ncbi:phosphatidylserine decarboxylase, partial [Gemmatimonas sp.]|uniref:phosphatidylserine decarboxylase n=1 Tax=Gemmatimonas sp. TaxID=1962908 RepID=UPI0039838E74
VNPPRPGTVREWYYTDQAIQLAKGDEMGRFLLGSTVVLLFPPKTVAFTAHWATDVPVRMGEPMGRTP